VVRAGQPAHLGIDGDAVEPTGVVTFVDPVLDRRSRTARVRVEVDNPAGPDGSRPLRIGQRVDVRLSSRVEDEGADPWAVPRSAVMSTGERDVVYLLFTEQARGDAMVRDWQLDPARLPDPVYYEMVAVRAGPPARADDGEEFLPLFGLAHGAPQLADLREGLIVVTRGNLLLDSQAQLSGRPSLLFPEGNRGGRAGTPAGQAGHAGH
jgi:Cu(I)/Ag(I) efflux system membrane fusion protein